ncbi:MAG: antibiotic biosynthesis monooxygenase [Bacteroidaceae bacterium]|nr:antibiotic biosynthesis monooxygenase [Bacteroidaceae bacterium]MBQ9676089.1 antibiotic biosynthesis monooxygenase [Bacteroidaceae bacterium]
MKRIIILLTSILMMAMMTSCNDKKTAGSAIQQEELKVYDPQKMLVRLSVIEVYPEYLDEYLAAAATVGGESVKKEPGVICIYPSHLKSDKCQIRILEIYRDQEAYQSHIASEHFQIYKQGTLHMVKNLELIDMNPLDPEAMQYIFRK